MAESVGELANSNNSDHDSELSPWACKITGTPRLTAATVPSPPSASLTIQTKRDQARSDTELGMVLVHRKSRSDH